MAQPLLSRRLLVSFPSTSSSSCPSTTRPNNSRLSYATSIFVNGEVEAQTHKRHSKSYLARQSAIPEVQQSSDLDSALSRFLTGCNRKERLVLPLIVVIKFLGESLNPMGALEIYNSIQDESIKSNLFVCNGVLGSLIRNGKSDSGFILFQQMKQDGLIPDIVSCLQAASKPNKVTPLLLNFSRNCGITDCKMDSVIYGTILAICASNNKWEEAEGYFNEMKDEGHLPSEFHHSSLLNAYSISGNYKKGEILVQDMKSAGLVPNKVTLTTLLKVYVRGGLFEKS